MIYWCHHVRYHVDHEVPRCNGKVQLHLFSGIYKCILYCNRAFWLIVVCFYGFQCNSSAVCESLKGFFCDLQTAWRLVLSMKPWSYIWLEFGLFSTIITIIRACACWALFVVTLTNTVHLIYIYIYIYIVLIRESLSFLMTCTRGGCDEVSCHQLTVSNLNFI